MKSIDTEFIYREIEGIVLALSLYGFHVTCITGDGAAENQSVFKRLCTHTAKEALPEVTLLENLWIEQEFPLAFQHPHPDLTGVMIFIMGDMPHIIKKLVNVLEMSSYKDSQCYLMIRPDKHSISEHVSLDQLYQR